MKRILAITGIVLLLGMYFLTLILSVIDNPIAGQFFVISIAATFFVPVFLWVILLFWKNKK